MTEFQNSQTMQNLMRAFAGESQARNRYTFAADMAKRQKLPALQAVFLYTANQEKEHAEIFYNFLQEMNGKTIEIDGGYPVDSDGTLWISLRRPPTMKMKSMMWYTVRLETLQSGKVF